MREGGAQVSDISDCSGSAPNKSNKNTKTQRTALKCLRESRSTTTLVSEGEVLPKKKHYVGARGHLKNAKGRENSDEMWGGTKNA